MTVRDIALMGNPVLDQRAEEVTDVTSPETKALVQDMLDTMAAAGGIGLAAPQIGVSKRVMIFYPPPDTPDRPESLEGIDVRVLINPVVTYLDPEDEQEEDWEGCLSVPALKGLVPRHRKIRYQGQDIDGSAIDVVAQEFHARVVQHEFDHLDGILYPKRLTDLSKLHYIQEWNPMGHDEEEMEE
jgi:peptide deformylase